MENWVPVYGYEGRYEVSDVGNIRSLIDNKHRERITPLILKQKRTRGGYKSVGLRNEKGQKFVLIHRIELMSFKGLPESDDYETMHLNDIRDDNRLVNLKWGTHQDNVDDKVMKGRSARNKAMLGRRGSMNGVSKPVGLFRNGICEKTFESILIAANETKINAQLLYRYVQNGTTFKRRGITFKLL